MADEVRFCTVIPGSCCFQHMLAAEEGGGGKKAKAAQALGEPHQTHCANEICAVLTWNNRQVDFTNYCQSCF